MKYKLVLTVAALILLPNLTASIAFGQAPAAFAEEPATLRISGGELHGTLMLPKAKAAFPVVLLIAGSGPTDRNGNTPVFKEPNNSLKMLAEALAASGIASLRYDKRGSGDAMALAGDETTLRFDTYINDAVLWAKQLRADKRFSTLTIAGHSEGSLIGMIAAKESSADAYVSIAGLGRAAGTVILGQIRSQLPPDLMKTAESIVADLNAGKTVAAPPQSLYVLFRPNIQPYLISWFRRDPSAEIAKLTVPVLIAQGTTDIQVSVDDAKSLSKSAPKATLTLIDGMNHVLKMVPADMDKQTRSYSDPTLPLAQPLSDAIVKFVKKVKKNKF
ncbi:alpha/beta hydrolase [soil metagenome]